MNFPVQGGEPLLPTPHTLPPTPDTLWLGRTTASHHHTLRVRSPLPKGSALGDEAVASLFHVEHLDRVAEWVGIEISPDQVALLEKFRDWLISEAIPAGGIGPHEAERIETRHIIDSLLYARFLHGYGEIVDLGSGVGLPGIPLAIAFPDTSVVLVDRSGRRVELARRAVRVLGLKNVEVTLASIEHLEPPVGAIVSRASLPPDQTAEVAKRLLDHDGIAVLGGSWTERPDISGWETIEVPRSVLDRPVWILIMRKP